MSDKSDAEIVQDLAAVAGGIQGTEHGCPFVVVPEGYRVHGLEPLLSAPTRIRAQVTLTDLASFAAYWEKFRTEHSLLMVDAREQVFRAVFDYHSPERPAWASHEARLLCRLSPEWIEWKRQDGGRMTQEEFADFIEANLADIREPDGDTLLNLVCHFQQNSRVRFTSSIRLESGLRHLEYTEDEVKGKVSLPATIRLALPVFEASEKADRVEAHIRTRVDNGKLVIWYSLVRPHRVLELAFADLLAKVTEATGVTPLRGSF